MQTPEIALNFGEDGITGSFTPQVRGAGISRLWAIPASSLKNIQFPVGMSR